MSNRMQRACVIGAATLALIAVCLAGIYVRFGGVWPHETDTSETETILTSAEPESTVPADTPAIAAMSLIFACLDIGEAIFANMRKKMQLSCTIDKITEKNAVLVSFIPFFIIFAKSKCVRTR